MVSGLLYGLLEILAFSLLISFTRNDSCTNSAPPANNSWMRAHVFVPYVAPPLARFDHWMRQLNSLTANYRLPQSQEGKTIPHFP